MVDRQTGKCMVVVPRKAEALALEKERMVGVSRENQNPQDRRRARPLMLWEVGTAGACALCFPGRRQEREVRGWGTPFM